VAEERFARGQKAEKIADFLPLTGDELSSARFLIDKYFVI
jgi:hypothetical protein